MSQVFHAVLESRGVLVERLRVRYEPEGEISDETVCVVYGTFKGEDKPREWRSPKLGERKPKAQKRTNNRTGEEYEVLPGSPLWLSKPFVQLWYDTSRDWVRIYCPDVTMGIYDKDEMDEAGFEPTSGPPPTDDGGLSQRLSESALRSAGFSPSFAAQAIDEKPSAGDNAASVTASGIAPVEAERGDGESSAPPSPPSSPTEGSQQASDDPAATPGAETAEGRPEPSRRRPRPAKPEGDDATARLV
jgi:hypothetical protein